MSWMAQISRLFLTIRFINNSLEALILDCVLMVPIRKNLGVVGLKELESASGRRGEESSAVMRLADTMLCPHPSGGVHLS